MTLSRPHAYAAYLLSLKLGIYGRAVNSINIDFHWANKNPKSRSLCDQAKEFNESLKKLPRLKFNKRDRSIDVDIVSLQFAEEQKDERPTRSDLKHGTAEFLEALLLIKEKLKFDAEIFDINGFIREATGILNEPLPNAAERKKVVELTREASDVAYANTCPLEYLTEMDEWQLFHANAKSLLVTPIFWTKKHGGPHGTEVGADVLREFARWNVAHRRTSPLKFLAALLNGWNLSPLSKTPPELGLPKTTAPNTVLKWQKENPELLKTTDEIAIAVAFAVFKLRGRCQDEISTLALAAIKRRKLLIEKKLVKTSMPNPESNYKIMELAVKGMSGKRGIAKVAAQLLTIQRNAEPQLSPRERIKEIDFRSQLKYCYEDLQPFLEKELKKLRTDLLKLPAKAAESRKLKCVERCVKSLNALEDNDKVANRIDTDEREILCDLIYGMGDSVGLDSGTEYVDQWREW